MPGDRGPLRSAIENWWKEWDPSKRIRAWVAERVDAIEDGLSKAHPELRKYAASLPPELGTLKQILSTGSGSGRQFGIGETIGFFIGLGFTTAQILLGPVLMRVGHIAMAVARPMIPSPAELVRMAQRGIITQQTYYDDMLRLGWEQHYKEQLYKAAKPVLDPGMLIVLSRRYPESLEMYKTIFRSQGWTDDDWDSWYAAYRIIPGVQDLITMQVREAWNDQIAARFEYDKGDKSKVKEWAAKQGLDPDWVDRFWRAHWQLPGISTGTEMVHRLREGELKFTEKDLDLLMAANDIPPFFRERILAISHALLTRVDIRRLYQAGLLEGGIDDLVNLYRDLGYTPEHAQMLAEFAAMGASESEKDLTKGEIVGAYIDGIISDGDCRDNLVKMGYDKVEAQILLDRADLDIAKAQLSEVKEYIKQRFSRGVIDDITAKSELGKYGLKAETIDGLLLSWTREKKAATTMPTQAKAETWYIKNIITLERYTEYLIGLNYAEEEIGYMLADADRKRAAGTISSTEV